MSEEKKKPEAPKEPDQGKGEKAPPDYMEERFRKLREAAKK